MSTREERKALLDRVLDFYHIDDDCIEGADDFEQILSGQVRYLLIENDTQSGFPRSAHQWAHTVVDDEDLLKYLGEILCGEDYAWQPEVLIDFTTCRPVRWTIAVEITEDDDWFATREVRELWGDARDDR